MSPKKQYRRKKGGDDEIETQEMNEIEKGELDRQICDLKTQLKYTPKDETENIATLAQQITALKVKRCNPTINDIVDTNCVKTIDNFCDRQIERQEAIKEFDRSEMSDTTSQGGGAKYTKTSEKYKNKCIYKNGRCKYVKHNKKYIKLTEYKKL